MNYVLFATLVIGMLVVSILVLYGVRVQRNNGFLAAALLCLCYSLFATWLVASGSIANVPYLARVGNIFGYLAYPMLYLFARNTFYPGRLWRRTDLLFLAPALFYIVDYLPFYLSPAHKKIELIRDNLTGLKEIHTVREEWLSFAGFHYVFRTFWCAFVYVLLLVLLYRNWRYEKKAPNPENKAVFRFILMFVILYLPLTIILFGATITNAPWWDLGFLSFTISCPLLGAGLYLLFSPGALYGFRPLTYINPLKHETTGLIARTQVVSAEKEADNRVASAKYTEQLIAYMETHRPYKEAGLTIHKLAGLTGIPVYIISYIINNDLNSNFNAWVNNYRIQHFLSLSRDPGFKQFSMEALAVESGFSSRVTFSTIFKREMGESPGKYLKSLPNQFT